jgi:MoxR-like ATPase
MGALATMLLPHLAQHFASSGKAQNAIVIIRDEERREVTGTFHAATPKILKLISQGLNVMLVGPAGCGKTMIGEKIAEAYNRVLTCISCSAGMSESQLLGRLLPIGEGGSFRYVESPFIKAYREGGVILLDEIDAADANLLLAINAALANGHIDVEARAANEIDTSVKRHPDTIIIAAANTWGSGADTQYVGRAALDASTLDRFYRVAIDYDVALEEQLAPADIVAKVHQIREGVRANKIRRVVSTRMITRIARAIAAGLSFAETLRDELASWTQDERAKVGA